MIKGIGIDLVYIPEMKHLIDVCDPSFIEHTFTAQEIINAQNSSSPAEYFSERFAAKEAFFKAVSSLTENNIDFRKIETLNNENGQPYIDISFSLQRLMQNINVTTFHISISADNDYAIAYVIAEGV